MKVVEDKSRVMVLGVGEKWVGVVFVDGKQLKHV